MGCKYHAIDIVNGHTVALVDVTCNPNDSTQLVGTITPLSHIVATEGREKMLWNVMALLYPFGTSEMYVTKDLLRRIGIPKEDLNTFRYIKVAA